MNLRNFLVQWMKILYRLYPWYLVSCLDFILFSRKICQKSICCYNMFWLVYKRQTINTPPFHRWFSHSCNSLMKLDAFQHYLYTYMYNSTAVTKYCYSLWYFFVSHKRANRFLSQKRCGKYDRRNLANTSQRRADNLSAEYALEICQSVWHRLRWYVSLARGIEKVRID